MVTDINGEELVHVTVLIKEKEEKYVEWLKNSLIHHKGKWLDMEGVIRYRKRALKLPDPNGSLIGEKRKLWMEMMEEYDVTELEACNILNGYGEKDPVGNLGKGIKNVEKAMKKAGLTNSKTYLFSNARHDIFHEINSGCTNQVVQLIQTWINRT